MWNESLKIKDWAVRDQAEGRKIPPASAGGNGNIRRQTGYYHISKQCLHSNSCDSLLRAGHFRILALIRLRIGWLCLMLHQENDYVLQNKNSRNLTLLFIAYTYSQPQKASLPASPAATWGTLIPKSVTTISNRYYTLNLISIWSSSHTQYLGSDLFACCVT